MRRFDYTSGGERPWDKPQPVPRPAPPRSEGAGPSADLMLWPSILISVAVVMPTIAHGIDLPTAEREPVTWAAFAFMLTGLIGVCGFWMGYVIGMFRGATRVRDTMDKRRA